MSIHELRRNLPREKQPILLKNIGIGLFFYYKCSHVHNLHFPCNHSLYMV